MWYSSFPNNSDNSSSVKGRVVSSVSINSFNLLLISFVEISLPLSFLYASEKSSFSLKVPKWVSTYLALLTLEIVDEEELEEITITSDIAGYNTPFAFDPEGEKKKKKKVDEALESKDIEIIKKLIRDVIGDVYRDIWIKRNSWK